MRYFQILLFSLHSFFVAYIAAPALVFLVLSLWSIQHNPMMADLNAAYWRNSFALLMTTAPITKTFCSVAAMLILSYWRKSLVIQICFWSLFLIGGGVYFFQELRQMDGKVYTAGLFRSTALILSVLSAIIVLLSASLSERLLTVQLNLQNWKKPQRLEWQRSLAFSMFTVLLLCATGLTLKLSFYITWIQASVISLLLMVVVASLQVMIQTAANWRSTGRPWVQWHCWVMVALSGGVMIAVTPGDTLWPYLTGGGFFLLIGFVASLIYAIAWLRVRDEIKERL